MNNSNLPGSPPRAWPVMRSGSTTLEAEDWQHGPTVEAVVVLLLREAFCLAADHVRQGGRSVVATKDVVCALKVLAHPTCDFIDTLVAPTRAEHAAGSQHGLERAVEAIESCALTLSSDRVAVGPDGVLRLCETQGHGQHQGQQQGQQQGRVANKYLDLMASADTWFEKHDHDNDSEEANHLTPMRRSVVAGVRAVIGSFEKDDSLFRVRSLEQSARRSRRSKKNNASILP